MKESKLAALLYGWIFILGLLLLSSIVIALFLRFTNLSESTLSMVTLIVGLLILFTGGLIAGMKGKSRGWIIGLTVGIGFTLFTFLIQYFSFNEFFTFNQSLYHMGYIISAMFGGMIGVNQSNTDHK